MGLGDFFLRVLFWHVVPSMSAVLLTFGFITLVLRLFRISQPNWCYWLLAVPLVKGLLVLILGAQQPPVIPGMKPIIFGFRLWDPLNLLSVPWVIELSAPLLRSSIVVAVLLVLLALLLGALVWRWVVLAAFYRSLYAAERLQRGDAPRVFTILDRLVPAMGAPYPEVAIAESQHALPCTVGVRHPLVLLSPELVEESSDEVLEAILAHELVHLVRRDNIVHWFLVLLRDVTYFNPFAHLVFSRVLLAKEQDCDRIAAETTGKPQAVVQAILHAAKLAVRKGWRPLPGDMSGVSRLSGAATAARARILTLQSQGIDYKRSSAWAKSLAVFLAVFALLFNFYVVLVFVETPPIFQF